jgi:glycosyltransferase involved in cell wall biosynthesis
MEICMIGCWYRDDMYSHHFHNLIEGITTGSDLSVRMISSNCNCFSSRRRFSITRSEILNENCTIVKIPYIPIEPRKARGKFIYYALKWSRLNYLLETVRGISFFRKTKGCTLIHFDQVLKSFGFVSFISLLILSNIFKKNVIVNVHEIDPIQEKHKKLNKYYNLADRVIVFSVDMKKTLSELGVSTEKIEVVPYCVSIGSLKGFNRDRFIYFGGHNLLVGKGFDTLLEALNILKLKGKKAKVVIYVGHGCTGLEEGRKKVSDMKLEDYIVWSEFMYGSKLDEVYQRSLACLIPFTGGSGRHPVTCAMANATPVIATRKASLPEYLGNLGIYISENAPEELANSISTFLENHELARSLEGKIRKRAEEQFSYSVVKKKLLDIYNQVYSASGEMEDV